MKIAFLWEYCGPYHIARINELRRRHKDVWLVELADRNITYAWKHEKIGDPFRVTLFPGQVAERIPAWHVFVRLRRWLRKGEIDVLFVPSYWPATSFAAALAAKSLGIKVVFMGDSHYASGSNSGLAIVVKRLLIRFYDAALVAGSLHRSFLRHLGMDAEKIYDGYDTVDNSYFKKVSDDARVNAENWRKKIGLPSKYILSLGRFVSKKNLDSVVRAYASLAARGGAHGHSLVLVGSGPMQERLVSLSASLSLEVIADGSSVIVPSAAVGSVYIFPFAQIDVVPVYYALATAFVLASTSDEWGLVVNEAMACECPILVSRSVGSSIDLVLPEITGYRFVPDNIHELAWCMEILCRDRVRARQMGTAASMHIADWGNDRFARNAIRAASAALSYPDAPITHAAQRSSQRTVWFLQTCFPDYRMPVFSRLHQRLGPDFHLFSGTSYFTPDIKTTTDYLDWHSFVENRFFFRRRFLWQTGACEAMFHGQVVVVELNPRIISTWVVLAGRKLWGAPTLLWGHAWGREDSHSIRNVLRLYMMRLASGTIAYTRSQRDEVRSVFPKLKIFAATNSLIPAANCTPESVDEDTLDTIIYVGRLNAPKKPCLLVEAFAKAKLPLNTKLCIVGEGAERAAIIARSVSLGVSERTCLLGHVHNHDVLRSLYARSFCSVSAGYVGLGAIQSFSFGVPLVLADNEPHAPEVEACVEGVNTLHFTAGDSSSLAKALEKMWIEKGAWLSRRQGLAQWTAKNYSVEAMVDGFIEAVDAVSSRNQNAI